MKILLIAAAALSLAGCDTIGSVVGTTSPIYAAQDKVVIEGTRALIIAHNAYQAAAAAMVPVVQSGRLSNAQLDKLQALSNRATSLLETGGTAVNAAGRASEVLAIVAEINTIIGR